LPQRGYLASARIQPRWLRKEKGWSQEEFADRADHRTYVSDIERQPETDDLIVGKLAKPLRAESASILPLSSRA
jgi:transcriptional regulator with XRE-family HTH domain